jgi:L-lactate dehydrogenase complex protein LldG
VSMRDVVLERVRRAVENTEPPPPIRRAYRERGAPPGTKLTDVFVGRVRDYRGTVIVTDDPQTAIAQVLAEQNARRIGIPEDLPARLRPQGVDLVEDEGLSPRLLDELHGALTACAGACATTGTVALDGGRGQGRRALTLLPDLHVCVVREEQIVETVPELVRLLEPAAEEGRPIVLVSGPSATSDIELERVEGVHGPRRLVVIVVR